MTNKNDKHTATKNYITDLAINLSDKHRKERSIGYNWEITISPRKKSIFGRIFSPGNDIIVKPVILDIKNLIVPEELELEGPLFTLCKGSELVEQHDLPFNVTLDSLSTTFSVFINEQNVIDFSKPFDLKATEFTVSFDLVCNDDSGIMIDETHVDLNMELTMIECEPKLELMLDDEIQYDSKLKDYFIGDFTVESTAKLKYPAPIQVQGKIEAILDDQPANNLIVIKNGEKVVDEISTGELKRGDKIIYSVFLLMDKMKNPVKERVRLDVSFSGYYRVGSSIDNKHLNILQESLDILQDAQGTELVVLMDSVDGERVDNNSEVRRPEYKFFAMSNTLNEITILLGNLAKDTSRRKAGLKILNLGMAPDIASGVMIYDSEGRVIDVPTSDIFRIDCNNPEIKNAEGVFIPNGDTPPIELRLLFSALDISNIKGARDFHFTMEAKITFEYYENRFGDEDLSNLERKTFTMTLVQPLYLQPNPQWLCVDYGSSAIVCLYKNEVINLRVRKDEIMKKAINDEKLRKDDFEKGTKFLSSDIVLHIIDGKSEISSFATEHEGNSPENYGKLSVFLSPTSSLYTAEALRLLPCLKLLVGNTWLPKNKYLEDYEYKRLKNGVLTTVKAKDDRKSQTSLLKVDQVFLQSYEALFRYYISSVVSNRDNINRLVLTYPNTYTPRHIGTLRKLVKSAFPAVRMLEFVSESDAVAAYYLKHWTDYAKADADFYSDEKILVYDMGAGTLDISYIDKHKDENGNLIMEILGKLGTSKAGNYLDFVLAEIVKDLCDLDSNIATTKEAIDEETSYKRTELKLFVKTQLKLNLKKEKRDKKLTYNKNTFNIGQVLDHPKFEDYLNACTKDILTQLVNYMERKVDKVPINTVLLSGRSCLLEPLRDKLKDNISKVTKQSPRFLVLDNPQRNLDGNKERQKTSVAEGAMEIADNYRRANSMIHVKSKRHYASFGLAYEIPGGQIVYREILNHLQIPDSNSMDNFITAPIRIDKLNNVSQLVLIQTYLSAKDTEEALNKADYQFVSEMEIINTQALGAPSSIEPKLCIDSLNDIIVYFGTQRTPGQQPLGEDLHSEDTKRSIWPFTI